MSWRQTWRETVESFLREVRDPDDPGTAGGGDALVAAIAAARQEGARLERELEATGRSAGEEAHAAEDCMRRHELALRIGDRETAAIAERFGRRHRERSEVLERKHDVLRDELALARAALNDLLDLARGEPRGD